MARQPRIEFKGACYHVFSQGDKRENIFHNDEDRSKFLEKTEEVVNKFRLKIHCYVLMDDHFHLLMETPDANLSRAMHQLNCGYSNWFKSKYQIKGSVFQGRYRAILVEKNGYLLLLSAYLHLNPVRLGIVKKPEDYRWSSYKSYIKKGKDTYWLYTKDLLTLSSIREKTYRDYVVDIRNRGDQIKKEDLFGVNSILGGDNFRKRILRKIDTSFDIADIREKPALRSLRRLSPEKIKSIISRKFKVKEEKLLLKKRGNIYRKLFLYALKKYSDLRLREIGALFEMDYVAVSQMVRRFILEAQENRETKLIIDRFEMELKKYRK